MGEIGWLPPPVLLFKVLFLWLCKALPSIQLWAAAGDRDNSAACLAGLDTAALLVGGRGDGGTSAAPFA